MPSLQDLATNLASHHYYSGYGTFNANALPADSGQLIVRKIGQKWSPSNLTDNLTPFGAITTVNRTLSDVARVGKFLLGTTTGLGFLAKQTSLQLMNANIEHNGEALPTNKPVAKQGFLNNAVNTISNVANRLSNDYGPTRIYNPLGTNTLAEVAVVASGLRFTKHGLTPDFNLNKNAYANYILDKDSKGNNRLEFLTNTLSNGNSNESQGQGYVLKYKGGSDSFYGIGSTTIGRYSKILLNPVVDLIGTRPSLMIGMPIQNLLSINNGAAKIDPALSNNSFGFNSPEAKALQKATQIALDNNSFVFGYKSDFRIYKNQIPGIQGATVLTTSDYKNYNVEDRIGVSRARTQQERNLNPKYSSEVRDTADKVNLISLFYSSNVDTEKGSNAIDVNGNNRVGKESRDLVKFRIKSIDNNNPIDGNDNNGVYMIFRAYLSNIRRSFNSKWNAYNYVGRGESFYLYDGFTESISFSFVIAASSRAEMKPLYQKLNYLISTLTPDYNSKYRMRGNIAELTIGDFIKYQPGVITQLDISVDNEDSNWEIALDEPEQGVDADMHELPQLLRCNMTFIPIYNFLPKKSAEAPFIGIDNTEGSDKKQKEWIKGLDTLLKNKK